MTVSAAQAGNLAVPGDGLALHADRHQREGEQEHGQQPHHLAARQATATGRADRFATTRSSVRMVPPTWNRDVQDADIVPPGSHRGNGQCQGAGVGTSRPIQRDSVQPSPFCRPGPARSPCRSTSRRGRSRSSSGFVRVRCVREQVAGAGGDGFVGHEPGVMDVEAHDGEVAELVAVHPGLRRARVVPAAVAGDVEQGGAGALGGVLDGQVRAPRPPGVGDRAPRRRG
jgi:hypothetical protein